MKPQWKLRSLAALMAVLCWAGTASAQKKVQPSPPLTLKVGQTAPDFTLLSFDGENLKKISLHDFRGKKNVVLAFYVFAFTGG